MFKSNFLKKLVVVAILLELCLSSFIGTDFVVLVNAEGTSAKIFSDDFDKGIKGWEKRGIVRSNWFIPKKGKKSVTLKKTGSIQKTISTKGKTNIKVSFYLGANSLESREEVEALWFDGSKWSVLAKIENGSRKENIRLHKFTVDLKSNTKANNNPKFALKFRIKGSSTFDCGFVDNIEVTGSKIVVSTPNSTIFSECETINDWTAINDCEIMVDTSEKISGDGSLKIISTSATGGGEFYLEHNAQENFDYNEFKNMEINIYVRDLSEISAIAFLIMTDDSNLFYNYIGAWELVEGWNTIRRGKSDFTAYNNASWNNINKISVKVEATDGENPEINIDKIAYNFKDKVNILFTFDDASQSVNDYAYDILEDYEYKATTWANKSLSTENTPDYEGDYVDKFMSEDTLKKLYENGWDVGNHTVSHNDYIHELPHDQMAYEFLENQKWLLDLGFDRSAHHVCYPMGNYDKEILDFLPTIGVKSARTTDFGTQVMPVNNIYTLKTIAIGRDTDLNFIYSMINRAVETNTSIFFMLHQVEPNADENDPNDTIKVSPENFEKIVAYVKNLDNQEKLEVKTISNWYEEYIANYPNN